MLIVTDTTASDSIGRAAICNIGLRVSTASTLAGRPSAFGVGLIGKMDHSHNIFARPSNITWEGWKGREISKSNMLHMDLGNAVPCYHERRSGRAVGTGVVWKQKQKELSDLTPYSTGWGRTHLDLYRLDIRPLAFRGRLMRHKLFIAAYRTGAVGVPVSGHFRVVSPHTLRTI